MGRRTAAEATATSCVSVRRIDFKEQSLPPVCAWTGEPAEKWKRVGPWRCRGRLPVSAGEWARQRGTERRRGRWVLLVWMVQLVAYNAAINWTDPRADWVASGILLGGFVAFALIWEGEWRAERQVSVRPDHGVVRLDRVHPAFAAAVAASTDALRRRTDVVRTLRDGGNRDA